jgi:hypothetical protein
MIRKFQAFFSWFVVQFIKNVNVRPCVLDFFSAMNKHITPIWYDKGRNRHSLNYS